MLELINEMSKTYYLEEKLKNYLNKDGFFFLELIYQHIVTLDIYSVQCTSIYIEINITLINNIEKKNTRYKLSNNNSSNFFEKRSQHESENILNIVPWYSSIIERQREDTWTITRRRIPPNL